MAKTFEFDEAHWSLDEGEIALTAWSSVGKNRHGQTIHLSRNELVQLTWACLEKLNEWERAIIYTYSDGGRQAVLNAPHPPELEDMPTE